ncbi:thymidine kinase [Selenihalanaerobacter shriftii]|uniref:Thymidine kinase n=1 Tax=Selenihalanaerobacter shriftii TaxID=142842 RepID=A0A1T4PAY7_9FIRM|nr:thymidine kinase [Selenihalanaerobacter shriftii]SJZ87978.1 thymidine kinase [Selenihalanaerobacter shriftii]
MHGYYGSVNSGWLEVITGVMYAGKSNELLRRVERAVIAKQEVVIFKPKVDDRYSDNEVVTHNGNKIKAEIVDDSSDIEKRFKKINNKIDVIAIDEGQFFDNGLIELVVDLADQGYRVIIAGLDMDFAGRGFEPMPELMARAEYVTKLHAVCVKCSNPATRNQRLINGEPASVDDPIIVVGADEKYEARCRNCHQVK